MNESTLRRTGLLLLVLSMCLLTFSPPLQAEEGTDTKLSDKLMIRGGWAYVFGASTNVTANGPVLGVGTNIDFTNTLGGAPVPTRSGSIPSTASMTDMPSAFPGIGSG